MSRSPFLPALLLALAACGPATAVLGPDLSGDGDERPDAEPPVDDATYEAEGLATALSRLVVRRFPADEGRCAFVTFVQPAITEEWPSAALPDGWGFDAIAASDRDDCRTWRVQSRYLGATAVRGWADWTEDPATGMPDRVDLELFVTFEDGGEIGFVARGVEVR